MTARAEAGKELGTRVLHIRYGLFMLAFALFVAGMARAEQLRLPRAWIGAAFLLVTVAAYASIGLLCRTVREADYFVAGRRVPALYNGLATAADWMSATSFIGTAGILYLQGFAGMAFILGWTGGYCLMALLLAPYLRRFGQYTIPDFLGARYGGVGPRLIGALAAILVSFVYVTVQIYGVGLIASHLTGFGFEIGILVGLGGVLVCSFVGGMRAVTWTQVAQYIVLIVAYLLPLAWLSIKQTGDPMAVISYGQQLQKVSAREQALMVDPGEQAVIRRLRERAAEAQHKLQDLPAAIAHDLRHQQQQIETLRAESAPLFRIQQAERELARLPRNEADAHAHYLREHAQAQARAAPLAGVAPQGLPFATAPADIDGGESGGARLNFLALVLCLMMGTASMPHVLTRCYTTPSVAETRRSVTWALFFIVLLYTAAPALAVLVKFEVLNHLVGLPIDNLPQWVRRWSHMDGGLVSISDINGDGLLQFGELLLGNDVIVLAAPEIGGLPYFVTCLVAAGGLAAALSTADGLLLTIANALSHDIYFRLINPQATSIRRVMMSKLLVMVVALLAAAIAALKNTDILQFVSAAFSLAAAAFFPALTLGIFWRRGNRAGAMAGMLVGLGLCGYYMAVNLPMLRKAIGITRPLAETQWFGVDGVSAAVFGVPAGLLALVLVSLLTRPPPAELQALVDAVRYPVCDPRPDALPVPKRGSV